MSNPLLYNRAARAAIAKVWIPSKITKNWKEKVS